MPAQNPPIPRPISALWSHKWRDLGRNTVVALCAISALCALCALCAICGQRALAQTPQQLWKPNAVSFFMRIAAADASDPSFSLASAIALTSSANPVEFLNSGLNVCRQRRRCGVPGLVTVAQTRASDVAALMDLASNNVEAAVVYQPTLSRLAQAQAPFDVIQRERVRAIGKLAPMYLQIIVRADSAIRSLADLSDAVIAVNEQHLGLSQIVQSLLKTAAPNATAQQVSMQLDLALDALFSNRIDAVFLFSTIPENALRIHRRSRWLQLLEPDQAVLAKVFADKADYRFVSVALPIGDSQGLYHNTYNTVATDVIFVVRSDLSTTMIYLLTRSLWHRGTLREFTLQQPYTEVIAIENAGVNLPILLHEGAKRYYEQALRVSP